ncbi:TnsA endonuclease N-terminal domain-containing protein [Lichenihabitans sp. Uapishka_5]|uniref:TnsA endonuclease N-terminal domain-containing protein n=1 Tax=Lichenihabitans sp. Uapishka_5 TaxID=3037302 RepID=UPI0029E7D204|nr:TnsA endonuclease N-terminal domain-containing protein [Lichenihabitans sp. Uapishka_5]MDX7951631.1 TnsA endonuclease N-terminal domain-containing protein [Lichenihabitans sp. Uapishka_5]
MGKSRYAFDEAKYRRFVREGRGRGDGPDYVPWIKVGDVPSRGRSHRVFCPLTGRQHHLLSDGEFYAFHLLWWNEPVVDLREQFPILRARTLDIAAALGVRHPVDPRSRTVLVQTTDLLATVAGPDGPRLLARAVKTAADLRSPRTREKLDIERVHWTEQGVDWDFMLDVEVKTDLARNVAWVRGVMGEDVGDARRVADALLRTLDTQGTRPVFQACAVFDATHGLQAGRGMSLLRVLLGLRMIETDMAARHISRQPASLFTWREPPPPPPRSPRPRASLIGGAF